MKIKNLKTVFTGMVMAMLVPLATNAQSIVIDETNFPDENFRSYLYEMSYGQDGVITEEEIESITSINVNERDISSLKGIEHFTALKSLLCRDNQLTTLDISNNTELTYLYCYYNRLTSLDVSNNTALTNLSCYNNQLTNLDVSNNTALTNLSCFNNQLTSLDVSNNTALTDLLCQGNQLTSLDVSNNTELTYLACDYNQLSILDVSNNTALTNLSCYNNQLTSLNVSNNTELTYLSCSNNQLSRLDVSKNTALKEIYCSGNKIIGVSMDALISSLPQNTTDQTYSLYVYDGSQSTERNVCTKAQVAAIKEKGWTPYHYDTTKWYWEEYEGREEGGLVIDEMNFPDEIFRNWLLEQKYGMDGVLTEEEISGITEIYVSYMDIGSLKGIEYFTALTYLDCSNNQLEVLDVSNNTVLTELNCGYNQLTTLDIPKNGVLTTISCRDNQLVTLDFSNCSSLTQLVCTRNPQLTTLDVSNCTVLTKLDCFQGQLTSLNVSNCIALTYIQCYRNQIKGEAMDAFVASLPQNTTGERRRVRVYDNSWSDEGNVCTKSQVALIKEKGWTPIGSDGAEYEGSDDEANGVDAMYVDMDEKNIVYTINGVKLNTSNLSDLPKGIYIVNGKKVVVK